MVLFRIAYFLTFFVCFTLSYISVFFHSFPSSILPFSPFILPLPSPFLLSLSSFWFCQILLWDTVWIEPIIFSFQPPRCCYYRHEPLYQELSFPLCPIVSLFQCCPSFYDYLYLLPVTVRIALKAIACPWHGSWSFELQVNRNEVFNRI